METGKVNHYLSKSLFIQGLQCHKGLWLRKYRPELMDEVDDSQQAAFDLGNEVGGLARKLFPGGVEVPYEGLTPADQLAMTMAEIERGTETIYEATFSHDNVFVKVDLLHKGPGGWELYEVKGSTEVKPVHIDDVAIQYYAVAGTGLPLVKASLVHIDNTYVRQGEIEVEKLFAIQDLTDAVREKQAEVVENLRILREMLQGDLPVIDIGPQCRDPYECSFQGHCWAHIPYPSVFDFADRGRPDRFELYKQGIIRMEDTPPDCLGWRQQMQLEGLISKKNVVNPEAVKTFISGLWFPLTFLDFETTFMTPIPLFDGTRPYQQVPFQFSLHWQEKADADLHHRAFLAPGEGDPREPFTIALLDALPPNACILVWNKSFEAGILRGLAEYFPERSNELLQLADDLVDLMAPFRSKEIYHWQFNGSYSIKAVLPALVPEFSYAELAINNGTMASNAWLQMRLTVDDEERARLRAGLLEYCHLDTLAMVKILEKMREVCVANSI